jgi:4-alpha-glucanotransferase
VDELRTSFDLPGMKVLQFAFGDDAKNIYLPHNYERSTVVYTGTHDNDTTIGWFHTAPEHERENAQRYLGRDGSDIAWDLIRLAQMSVADMAVFPLQDVFRLDGHARMNTPGRADGNWTWRYTAEQLDAGLAFGLRVLTATYGRLAAPADATTA